MQLVQELKPIDHQMRFRFTMWACELPHAYMEKPTHTKRVTVWCGFWFRGIIGPFLFQNEQGEAVTVNGDRYRAFLLNEFLLIKSEEVDIGNIWLQQDGATCHTQPKPHSIFYALFWSSELRFNTVGLLFVGCRQR